MTGLTKYLEADTNTTVFQFAILSCWIDNQLSSKIAKVKSNFCNYWEMIDESNDIWDNVHHFWTGYEIISIII